jgi:1-deoxy-D-xylulose-5-phosphate reductoisomerase
MKDSEKPTNLALLGSTGSIGRQALEVVASLPGRFRVLALAAGKNQDLLAQQVARWQPEMVALEGPCLAGVFRRASLEEIAAHPAVDLVVVATSGKAGLSPTLAALRAGKRVALANKEVLVMAGEIVMREARPGQLLPVDSEHSALWQCLVGEERENIARLVLTASGGPFLRLPLEELARITPEQALAHPTWRMGKKVTVDAATLMNKGFEAIEAHWLFGIPYERIEVLVHPQSLVHSLVEFVDGSVKAQIAPPDMRLPIQYALTYPQRLENPHLPRLDWKKFSSLIFEPPNLEHFPCLKLALEAGRVGGTLPAVLSAADEVAVELFLCRRILFDAIPRLVEKALESHRPIPHPSLEQILDADKSGREKALEAAGWIS